MSANTAHTIIRSRYGRGSRQDVQACYLLARGRFAEIVKMAVLSSI